MSKFNKLAEARLISVPSYTITLFFLVDFLLLPPSLAVKSFVPADIGSVVDADNKLLLLPFTSSKTSVSIQVVLLKVSYSDLLSLFSAASAFAANSFNSLMTRANMKNK